MNQAEEKAEAYWRARKNADGARKNKVLKLQSGNGGGTFDGMEARVSKLEADMTDIKVTLARMDERLSHLATKADLSKIEGQLEGKLGYWQFVGTGIAMMAILLTGFGLILRWSAIGIGAGS